MWGRGTVGGLLLQARGRGEEAAWPQQLLRAKSESAAARQPLRACGERKKGASPRLLARVNVQSIPLHSSPYGVRSEKVAAPVSFPKNENRIVLLLRPHTNGGSGGRCLPRHQCAV